ncbi:MAG TPA: ATP synthase subunit I [Stellaceae bacterium]|nr:ATP synthase subunit I [Stellaceae bacterium]
MTHAMLALGSAMAVAGFLFGLGYFATLQRTVGLFVSRHSLLGPAALTLGRIAAAAVFLTLAAKLGALPLLAAFLGFLVARAYALRAVRREG